MKKILRIVEIILIALGALAAVLWMVGLVNVDMMLFVAYAFVGIAALTAIVMTVMNMGKSRNTSKIGLFVFGACAVLAVVFYLVMSSSQPVVDAGGNVYDNVFALKASDTMLYLAYATLIGSVVFMLAGEIRNAIK